MKKSLLFFYGAGALVLLIALFTRLGPWLDRPLDHDEISQLNTSGPAYLPSIEAVEAIPAGDLQVFVEGVGRNLGGGFWDPYNHVVNSYAIAVTGFLFGYDAFTIRLPALLAFLGTVALLFLICREWSRSTMVASVLAMIVIVNPEIFVFSVTARGYSLMNMLVLLQVFLITDKRLYRNDWGLLAVWVCAMLHLAQFFNMVSTSLLWIAPFCLGVLFFPPKHILELEILRKFKRPDRAFQVFWIFSCVPAVVGCCTFVLINLRFLINAQQKYGVTLGDRSGIEALIEQVLPYAFPGFHGILLILAFAAFIVALVRNRGHWFIWTLVFLGLFMVLYSLISGKIMWPRNYLHLVVLVPLLLSLAYPALSAIARPGEAGEKSAGARKVVLSAKAVILAFAALVIITSAPQSVAALKPLRAQDRFLMRVQETDFETFRDPQNQNLLLEPWIIRTYFFLPGDDHWKTLNPPEQGSFPLDLYFISWPTVSSEFVVEETDAQACRKWLFRTLYWDRDLHEHNYWCLPQDWLEEIIVQDTAGLLKISTRAERFAGPAQLTENSIILWRSDATHVTFEDAVEGLKNELTDYLEIKATLTHDPAYRSILTIFPNDATEPVQRLEVAQAAVQLWGGTISIAEPLEAL